MRNREIQRHSKTETRDRQRQRDRERTLSEVSERDVLISHWLVVDGDACAVCVPVCVYLCVCLAWELLVTALCVLCACDCVQRTERTENAYTLVHAVIKSEKDAEAGPSACAHSRGQRVHR